MRNGVDCKNREWEEIDISNVKVDISGDTFGNLVALFPVKSGNKKQWLCKCNCGNDTVVQYGQLNAEKVKSCGCSSKRISYKPWMENKEYNDFIGKKYGKLTIIDYLGVKNKKAIYRFKCDCGTEIDLPIARVACGNTSSCGCLQREKNKEYWADYRAKNNIIGDIFGNLTVVKFLRVEDQKAIYLFHCSCGNLIELPIDSVKTGNTRSCGCLWDEWRSSYIDDVLGKRFGRLVVNSYAGIDHHGGTLLNCICDCGNHTVVNRYSLTRNRTHSCGCISSVGESNIKKILKDSNIRYKSQYSFSDLLSDFGYCLFYDFGILNDDGTLQRLIEFDGTQHIRPYDYFGGEERFLQIQRSDFLKNQYALSHNIPLVRIPYYKRDSMTIDDLLGPKYLIEREVYDYAEIS